MIIDIEVIKHWDRYSWFQSLGLETWSGTQVYF